MALAIAIVKASLVVLFFMHVKYSSRLTKLLVGVAFFFLGIMLSADDVRLPVARLVYRGHAARRLPRRLRASPVR